LRKIWANLNTLGKIWAKFGKIWCNLIRFGQNSKSCIPKNIQFPTAMETILTWPTLEEWKNLFGRNYSLNNFWTAQL